MYDSVWKKKHYVLFPLQTHSSISQGADGDPDLVSWAAAVIGPWCHREGKQSSEDASEDEPRALSTPGVWVGAAECSWVQLKALRFGSRNKLKDDQRCPVRSFCSVGYNWCASLCEIPFGHTGMYWDSFTTHSMTGLYSTTCARCASFCTWSTNEAASTVWWRIGPWCNAACHVS